MEFFMFSELINRFVRKSPISVMNRALLEHTFLHQIDSTQFLKTIVMCSGIASGCFRQLSVLCFWYTVAGKAVGFAHEQPLHVVALP
jgi:hypothetical protein